MHALSIKQPYAWQILTGDKPYEYRTWLLGTVQQFLLVSSSQPSAMDFGWGLANGYALAVVDITGTPQLEDDGSYAWPVKVHAVVTPFPVKGKLHFFEVQTPKFSSTRNGRRTSGNISAAHQSARTRRSIATTWPHWRLLGSARCR
ncbi:hypothetical protein [Schleiferilactobacillus harbinensis]|uniref:hypothetical protein n=1 Tax=Schleiferilactobacillus harbinensis TaxID=304207 RepID=UPI0007B80A8A|nr:hypothetical protein [Schleiferilactobacillus harbinensis]